MKYKTFAILLALGVLGSGVAAQAAEPVAADTTAAAPDTTVAAPVVPPPAPATQASTPASTPPPATSTQSAPNDRIYYGGTVTLSLGSTTRIGFFPMVGYKFTPKISGGVEAGYEYVSYGSNQSSNNYGGSVFARFRVRPSLYAHGEYQAVNYEIFTGANSSTREWVPFLLVGGGVVRAISPRTAVYAEVLFDVLQDDRSPYESWEPVVSVGVAVGF